MKKEIGVEGAREAYKRMVESKKSLGLESKEREPRLGLETHVYIVRHGTSTPEVEDDRPLQERDFERELSEQGVEESKAAGKLMAEDVARYISDGIIVFPGGSTHPRAYKTAEYAMREINKALGYPVPEDSLPDPSIPGVHKGSEKRRNYPQARFEVPGYIHPPHAVGKLRLKAEGRWGRGETLPEEWMRNPDQFQQDINGAGLKGEFDARAIIQERIKNFVNQGRMFEKSSRVLYKRWKKYMSENPEEGKRKLESDGGINISADKPPHMVFIGGTHGSIIPEAWLYEIIKPYEARTGEVVSPTLEYAEYFKIYIPADESQDPTLTIHGKTMPIPWRLLGVVHNAMEHEGGAKKDS